MAKFDIYEMISDKIIEKLEGGKIPWEKPWDDVTGAYSGATGKPYSLLNQMMLDGGEYWTFKQIQEKGGKLKKGAKSSQVVFWKFLEVEREDGNGKKYTDNIPMLRYYNVFNVDDCEGIEKKYNHDAESMHPTKPLDEAETIFSKYIGNHGIKFSTHKQNRAFYAPAEDKISIPVIDQFKTPGGYYGTLFHEAVHSTGHKNRLNRFCDSGSHKFGSDSYSKEELVAEIGAASILSMLGIETDKTFENTVAYCQSWIEVLKNDKKLIVSAAGKASKAVGMIIGDEN